MKHKMIRLFLVFALVSPLWAQTLETRVGNQIWAGVNLDVARFRNGDVIPEAKTKEAWLRAAAKKQPAWCYYENKTDNGRHFGKLYNWYAVNDPRGLAPEGWHIASEEEWEELFRHLAGKSIAGLALKTREGWLQDGNGTDVVGFHAMPGGNRFEDGHFEGINEYTGWWTTTEADETNAYDINLTDRSHSISSYQISKEDGLYVRCVKNTTAGQSIIASGSRQ